MIDFYIPRASAHRNHPGTVHHRSAAGPRPARPPPGRRARACGGGARPHSRGRAAREGNVMSVGIGIFAAIVVFWVISGLRVIQQYEAGVIFRLGRFAETKRAGLNWIVPGVDRIVKVDLRTVTRDVPPQDVITRDNVSLKVSAVIYFRVVDAERAIIQVENFLYATSQLAQTTLRSTLGKLELDDLLAQREKINKELQVVLAVHTEPWGIKVTAVEVKQLDLPPEMQRAMARQAEAERERRAKVIAAEGE